MANGSGPEFGERAEYGPDDVCYRHPGVASFTLCQRCGRTICPECQVESPVGLLCTDCLRQTEPKASVRAARSASVTARRVAGLGTPVSYAIMAISALVYIAQLIGKYFGADEVTLALWYAPLYSLPGSELIEGLGFEPWRMVTAMFTHSTGFIFHILFNMYALWLFGRHLEETIGRAMFLVLYLFAGLGGSLAVMFWGYVEPGSLLVPTVGASGAIFGVFAATFLALRAARQNVTSLAVLIGINFAIGFIPGVAISWQAHLGGMLVGAATMGLILATRGPRKRRQRVLALVGFGAVLVLLSGAYLVVLPDLALV